MEVKAFRLRAERLLQMQCDLFRGRWKLRAPGSDGRLLLGGQMGENSLATIGGERQQQQRHQTRGFSG
ncbi:MAG: hypothetical protein BWY76_01095 [bacterium ADurb.Bin429]|nr:MAG: hypothetical protein BWY76_01095 [bacterium ADurb.Bin429]